MWKFLTFIPKLKLVQKGLVVDSSPKLTNNDWIKEQSEDSSIGPSIQLLKSDKLKHYIAKKLDSSCMYVLMKYQKDLFLKKWAVVSKSSIEKPPRAHYAVCVTTYFCA